MKPLRLLPYLTLLMFCVLCSETRGDQTDANPVSVQKITLLENKKVRLTFNINVQDVSSEVVINLDHLSDPKSIEDSLKLADQNGAQQQLNPSYDKKKLKIKIATEGIYHLTYIDPTIPISGPEYSLVIKQDQTNHHVSGNRSGAFKLTNNTKYNWPQNIKIEFTNKQEQVEEICSLTQVRGTGESSHIHFGPDEIRSQFLKYIVSITEFETNKVSPTLIIDMKQAWAQKPLYYQLPGTIKVKVDGAVTSEVKEKDFKTTVESPSFPLIKRKDLVVTREVVDYPFIRLDNQTKKTLTGTFFADYLYQYKTGSGPDLAFLTPSAKKITTHPLKAKGSLRFTHKTTLPAFNLLVETDDVLGTLKSQMDTISHELKKWIDLTNLTKRNYRLNASILKQTKLLDDLTHIHNQLNSHRHSRLLELIAETKTTIQSDSNQRIRINLELYFKDVEKLAVKYSSSDSANYKKLYQRAIHNNEIYLERVKVIGDNARKIADFFKNVASESDHYQPLRSLASLGAFDARVTLLRKQREEQTKMAKCFMMTYNALVMENADIDTIIIEVRQVGVQSNLRRPVLGPGAVATELRN